MAATLATYCPSRMVEHPKSVIPSSPPDFSPCISPPQHRLAPLVAEHCLLTSNSMFCHCMNFLYQVGRPLVPRGFVRCFLRVPQAVGLYCSCHDAPASEGNFQKTYYKMFQTSGRPTWYQAQFLFRCQQKLVHDQMDHPVQHLDDSPP